MERPTGARSRHDGNAQKLAVERSYRGVMRLEGAGRGGSGGGEGRILGGWDVQMRFPEG